MSFGQHYPQSAEIVSKAFLEVMCDPTILRFEYESADNLVRDRFETKEDIFEYLGCAIIFALSPTLKEDAMHKLLTIFSNRLVSDGFGELRKDFAECMFELSYFIDLALSEPQSQEYTTLTHYADHKDWMTRRDNLGIWASLMHRKVTLELRHSNVTGLMPHF